jgi:hypothetical protein
MMEIKGPAWNPVGETVWLYPEDNAGLKYKVLFCSPHESRLELVSPSGLRVRKVQVTTGRDDTRGIIFWTETAQLGNIPFYFDGATMGIMFSNTITLSAGHAIYIDLPAHTDVRNLDWRGCYWHSLKGYGADEQQVHMGDIGTYIGGPRLHSDHS